MSESQKKSETKAKTGKEKTSYRLRFNLSMNQNLSAGHF